MITRHRNTHYTVIALFLSTAKLKAKFQRVHRDVVNQNLRGVIDRLFEVQVISTEDARRLLDINGTTDQARQLMLILHGGGHPRAFIELRAAIAEERTFSFIIDKLDALVIIVILQLQ